MPTLQDENEKVRLTTRVPTQLRDTLEQAARLQGASLNQFMVQTAFQEAQRILERETVIRLSREDAQQMFSLMEDPPKANRRLKEAVKSFKATVRA